MAVSGVVRGVLALSSPARQSVWMALAGEGGQDCKLLPWSLRWLCESSTSLAAVSLRERQIRAVRGL